MKVKILLGCALATMMFTTSCNDALDMEPISQITPDAYYTSASQVQTYLNNYYNASLVGPFGVYMYHEGGWNAGMNKSDANTDILVQGVAGNTTLFANDHWDTPSAKQLQGYYANVRAVNFVMNKIDKNIEAKILDGSSADVKNAKGEAHFMRALFYFRILGTFGDAPIVTEVLENSDDAIIPQSKRASRNEVAKFILEDLDAAIANLYPRSTYSGQRFNKEAAQVFASRVALFEGTFEKYHAGTPRVKTDESAAFLNKAMQYAQPVADAANLTANNGVVEPTAGVTGWNPYFEMFSQPSLVANTEVLLWKEYSNSLSVTHDVPYRTLTGCADGLTRNFVQSFLMADGTPIYASQNYKGDDSYANVIDGRDPRLHLFVWTDQTLPSGEQFTISDIITSNQEIRNITGYQSRKYFTYDPVQISDDALHGTNACPIFRATEAMLNYMEACVEVNGSLNDNARKYWVAIRARAGVSTDVDATIAATDLDKEYDNGNGDFGVYSGTTQVSKLLYNVRRERMNEMFNEGLRRLDLVRWRAYDNMLTKKWIPEGVHFWAEGSTFENDLNMRYGWDEEKKEWKQPIVTDGTSNANLSAKTLSEYLRPYSINMTATNELREGLNWHEAYYLAPLGVDDITSASADRDVATSEMTQNPYWSTTAGSHAEK